MEALDDSFVPGRDIIRRERLCYDLAAEHFHNKRTTL